jgi:glycosyltransferase involved in cell wall biosynthesis
MRAAPQWLQWDARLRAGAPSPRKISTLAAMPASAIHLIHHAFRKGGGMERCAVSLATALRQMDRRVVVHTMTPDVALAESLGIELNVLKVPLVPRKLQSYRFFRAVEQARAAMDGLQIAFSRVRVRDVAICGGTHRGYLERTRKWTGPFDVLQSWMEHQSYRGARTTIAHSDLIAGDLVKHYGFTGNNIPIIYPPVDERFTTVPVQPSRDDLRRKLGWPKDKIVFLFPSKGHRNKGLHRICTALESFRDDVVLAVAGRSTGGSQPSFVMPLGFVEDMVTAYRAADFTTLGSYYESFGLVGPESILCGTRLVFEQSIGCLPVIKPELVFPFSVWDLESMKQAFARAIKLAREGRHRIEQPSGALRYDPSPAAHAAAVLQAATRECPKG